MGNPQWLVCSCHSSNVCPTNLSRMAVEIDALGNASVKLLHKRSPWKRHTHNTLYPCSVQKKEAQRVRNQRKGWTCCVQFTDIMPHDLLTMNVPVRHTTPCCCQQHGERRALKFLLLCDLSCSNIELCLSCVCQNEHQSVFLAMVVNCHIWVVRGWCKQNTDQQNTKTKGHEDGGERGIIFWTQTLQNITLFVAA